MDADTLERFAIRAAKGNNGGEWATHYTEAQKEFWRGFVQDLAGAIAGDAARLTIDTRAGPITVIGSHGGSLTVSPGESVTIR